MEKQFQKVKENLKKLSLNKATISRLSTEDQALIIGGQQQEQAITSSFFSCTGWLCCEDTPTLRTS